MMSILNSSIIRSRQITKVIVFVIALMVCSVSVCAHQGKTDSNGGHNDRVNGGYHYHHGYPAHQHKNGECPYDFETVTQESEKEPSAKETSPKNNTSQSTNATSKSQTGKNSNDVFVYILSFLAVIFVVYGIPLIFAFKKK